MVQSNAVAMIYPRAHCDLELSQTDKGVLNAITYAGTLVSAIPWGFAADVTGRRKILVYGHFAMYLFDLLCGLSQSFVSLAVAKFFGGIA